jgi:hypothetical protein
LANFVSGLATAKTVANNGFWKASQ